MIRAAYLAAGGSRRCWTRSCCAAGGGIAAWHGRLALSPDPPLQAAGRSMLGPRPGRSPAPSVKAAADALAGDAAQLGAYCRPRIIAAWR